MNQKPKNEILKGGQKKRAAIFIKELHSTPELMSYSEKLELAEEIFCELIEPLLKREEVAGSVADVKRDTIVLDVAPRPSTTLLMEIQYLTQEETEGVFKLEIQDD